MAKTPEISKDWKSTGRKVPVAGSGPLAPAVAFAQIRGVKKPIAYFIAGCNGAGKTTFAGTFLPNYARCLEFVNADLIARGLSPFAPERAAIQAGRLTLERVAELTRQRADFALETTLSGRIHLKLIDSLKAQGYEVVVFYVWVPSVEMAQERIRQRVAYGGHNIPDNDVQRRFTRSIENLFTHYLPRVNRIIIYDNAGSEPRLIAEFSSGKWEIEDQQGFAQIAPRNTK